MADKEFIGFCKNHQFANGDTFTKISFKLEDLEKMKTWANEKGYINLTLGSSPKGPYLFRDTFVPKGQPAGAAKDDLPF